MRWDGSNIKSTREVRSAVETPHITRDNLWSTCPCLQMTGARLRLWSGCCSLTGRLLQNALWTAVVQTCTATRDPEVSSTTVCFGDKCCRLNNDICGQAHTRSIHYIEWTTWFCMCVLRTVREYLSDGSALSHAGRVGGGVVGIVEGLLVRAHGNLILPIEPVVSQFGHPFIKQLLRFNLQSRCHNQRSRQGNVSRRRRSWCERGKPHTRSVSLLYSRTQWMRSF